MAPQFKSRRIGIQSRRQHPNHSGKGIKMPSVADLNIVLVVIFWMASFLAVRNDVPQGTFVLYFGCVSLFSKSLQVIYFTYLNAPSSVNF